MKRLLSVCAVLSLFLLPLTAVCQENLSATLRGFEEPPSIASPTMGSFSATISADESKIEYTLTYDAFATGVLFAHIHVAQRGVNGNVVAFLCGGGGQAACPQPSGTISGTITPANIATVAAQQITGTDAERFAKVLAAIRGDVAYVNVHSMAHPGGEIRGQIETVAAGAEE